jgi:hypothetical protein
MAHTAAQAERGLKLQDINFLEIPLSKLPNLPLKTKLSEDLSEPPFAPFVDVTDLLEPVTCKRQEPQANTKKGSKVP